LNVIEINNLSVDYQGTKAIDNVSFSVNQNDFLGIIGPNGAGKTTLFACMLGIIDRYKGDISFFGENIRKSRKYLNQIGYVPQKPIFEKNFPVTVREVVKMGVQNPNEHKIDEILQQVWIHELDHRRLGELSTGQQQRVFIAKALVGEPKILILDEPVTGIDTQSTEVFYSILRELNKNQNMTIIWSSHDLEAVNRLANKVACLNKTLFFHGVSDEFFNNDELIKQYSESAMQQHMHHREES
jgi:zinc transport system ATP-binding protein